MPRVVSGRRSGLRAGGVDGKGALSTGLGRARRPGQAPFREPMLVQTADGTLVDKPPVPPEFMHGNKP
jgi:hypothetical protein